MKTPSSNKKDRHNLKGRMIGGAAILAIGGVVAKLIGALYRIPLTNILGAQGMGMYQLVFSVYALFMTISTAGIPTALSRIVAEKKANGEPAKKYLFACMLTLGAMSVIGAILVCALSKYIAIWQGNANTQLGYFVIAPSIVLVGIIAGFRGWFQGELNMLPTAISNVIEQIVKLGVGIGLAIALSAKGVTWAVGGALLGVSVAEAVALLYLFATYLFQSRRASKEQLRINRREAQTLFKVAFPIAIVSILMPLSSFFDSIIIVNALKWSGVEEGIATAQYGILSGPVSSLVNVPVVVIMSLAVAIVPSVSASRVSRDIDSIMLKSRLSIKISYLVGIPCAFFFLVFAKIILQLIYPSLSPSELQIGVNLLRIVSANVVFVSSMQIYVSLLQALDKTKMAVLSLVFAIILKIVLNLVLIRYIGILGAGVASVVMSFVALLGVNLSYWKICGLHLEKNVALNLLCGVIMALSGIAVAKLVKNAIASLIVGFLVCCIVYVFVAMLFGLVDRSEIRFYPFSKLIAKLHRAIRFWEYKNEDN